MSRDGKHADTGHHCGGAGSETGLYLWCGEAPASFPLSFSYNPAFSQVSGSEFDSAVRGAASAWNNPVPPVADGPVLSIAGSTTAGLGKDGKNVVLWGDPADCGVPGAVAVACLHYAGPSGTARHRIVEVDIVLNVDEVWEQAGILENVTGQATGNVAYANPTANWFDVQSAITHEFGHAIGLEHIGNASSVPFFEDLTDLGKHMQTMYSIDVRGSTAKRTLELGDLMGLREVAEYVNDD